MAGPLPTSNNLPPFAGTSLSHWEIKCFFPPGERPPHLPGWANCSPTVSGAQSSVSGGCSQGAGVTSTARRSLDPTQTRPDAGTKLGHGAQDLGGPDKMSLSPRKKSIV